VVWGKDPVLSFPTAAEGTGVGHSQKREIRWKKTIMRIILINRPRSKSSCDGVLDGDEPSWNVDGNGLSDGTATDSFGNAGEHTLGTYPLQVNNDGDGLWDETKLTP
jgi:hypothetical protein